jgi:hypothetical protein
MDEALFKVIFLLGSYISILDIFKIHREYRLSAEAIVNIYLHHLLIVWVVVGSFFQNIFLKKIHLMVCLAITCTWLWNRGCIMTRWQVEAVPYTKRDLIEIVEVDDDFTNQLLGHLMVMVPAISYDFYKILM